MTRVGTALGADQLPPTVAELKTWLATVPERHVGRQARRTARFLMAPRLPVTLLPPYGVVLAAAVSLLPVRDRVALRIPSFPPAEPLLVVPATRALIALAGVGIGPSPAHKAALARVGRADERMPI
jgi:hypothetical protein